MQLRNTKKGNSKMSEYLIKIKSTVDSLTVVGYDINSSEHIESILEGLPSDYDVFITSVSIRTYPFIVGEIEALLLAHETIIEKNSETTLYANLANVPFRNQYSNSNHNNN